MEISTASTGDRTILFDTFLKEAEISFPEEALEVLVKSVKRSNGIIKETVTRLKYYLLNRGISGPNIDNITEFINQYYKILPMTAQRFNRPFPIAVPRPFER